MMINGQPITAKQRERGSIPRFFTKAVELPIASERAGRPIYEDREFVETIFPGNNLLKPVKEVDDEIRARFPEEYERFKKGLVMAPTGTPVEEWPILGPSRVLELKALGFYTVESIAEAADVNLQRAGMGFYDLRERAKAFLDDASAIALTEKQNGDIQRLTFENESLKLQMSELRGIVDRLYADQMAKANAPHPLSTAIPGMTDPMEQARQGFDNGRMQAMPPLPAEGESSLASLPPRRRPGRPPRVQEGDAA